MNDSTVAAPAAVVSDEPFAPVATSLAVDLVPPTTLRASFCTREA